MAHIADLLVNPSSTTGLSNYISRDLSPHGAHETMTDNSPAEDKGKEKFIWRMHQPTETARKYQLFPSKDKLSIQPGRKSPDAEKTLAVGQPSNATVDRPILGSAMRLKAKEQNLIRRRKASVPELGPMTTVQEIAMDSPTIPGRPPLHERSISAPGYNSWKHNVFGDTIMSRIAGPALDEKAEITSPETQTSSPTPLPLRRRRSGSPGQPMSPKNLAPLVIPATSGPQPHVVVKQQSSSYLRLSSDPPSVPPKSARMLPEDKTTSPQSRTPYTPLTGSTTNLSSVTATPVSATTEGRASPLSAATTTSARGPSPMGLGHVRGQSESSAVFGHSAGHRRERSDASIMDRGRPKKRPDGSPITLRRTPSKQLRDQKAFETLPRGIKATDAGSKFDESEIDALKRQAVGQAAKFEVLGFKDVEALSRELRALDERCEYLRKTHHSLRSGRRNLHERICTYLRSPRLAQFSHGSLLKQEEALVELDLSIDDWVSKLEQAENRRTRVRQKLLEHVAAALTLSSPTFPGPMELARRASSGEVDTEPTAPQMMTMAIQRSMGENTPPRSPTKTTQQQVAYAASPSRSPTRLAQPVKVQEPITSVAKEDDYAGRMSKESIRIYADSDVYALLAENLLADVEEELTRMGEQQKQHLQQSQQQQELLTLGQGVFEGPSRNGTPKAVTPVM